MRLSDILKKTLNKPSSQENIILPEAEKTESKPQEPETKPKPADPVKDDRTPFLKADQTYTKSIIEVKNIITSLENNIPYNAQIESIETLVTLIEENNEDILILADRTTPDILLYGHCVNLCIFSLFLGKSFNYSREKLLALGFCALLNDIGLPKQLVAAPRKTPEDEAVVLKQLHTQDAIKRLPGVSEDIKTLIINVMVQKHNQRIFSGDSESIKGTDVYNFTRIIAIADVYETLTHPRAAKERILPHEALKSLISNANQAFDSEIIKLLIERLSLYPPGSYVKLNSEEIGRIVGINKGLPTRPRVKVIIDNQKQRLPEPRVVDLSANPMIFVREAIDETKLNLPDKILMLELKAMRWWVKGL